MRPKSWWLMLAVFGLAACQNWYEVPCPDPDHMICLAEVRDNCSEIGDDIIERTCLLDRDGQFHDLMVDPLPSFPNTGQVRLAYVMRTLPGIENLESNGPAAPFKVYAAPLHVGGASCCPEDDEANRIPISVVQQQDVLFWIEADLAAGFQQVAVNVEYGKLYPHQIPGGLCYGTRWYME